MSDEPITVHSQCSVYRYCMKGYCELLRIEIVVTLKSHKNGFKF